MMGNNPRSEGERPVSRAIVLRCPDETYAEVLQQIRSIPGVYIVYTKTSSLKLVVSEVGW